MADSNKQRGRKARETHADDGCQRQDLPDSLVKEYNYMLLVLPEELAVLEKYREALVNGTSGFAEAYYDYLFNSPDIAAVLYSFERGGGDAGSLIRAEMACMLDSVVNPSNTTSQTNLLTTGSTLREHGFRPLWIVASYNFLIIFLTESLSGLDASVTEKETLKSVTDRLLLRDMGLTLEGFWQSDHDNIEKEMRYFERELGAVVLDPTSVAFKVAEAMVDLGLRHSKIGRFARPPVKEIK